MAVLITLPRYTCMWQSCRVCYFFSQTLRNGASGGDKGFKIRRLLDGIVEGDCLSTAI